LSSSAQVRAVSGSITNFTPDTGASISGASIGASGGGACTAASEKSGGANAGAGAGAGATERRTA
jgi:hypothetical protein